MRVSGDLLPSSLRLSIFHPHRRSDSKKQLSCRIRHRNQWGLPCLPGSFDLYLTRRGLALFGPNVELGFSLVCPIAGAGFLRCLIRKVCCVLRVFSRGRGSRVVQTRVLVELVPREGGDSLCCDVSNVSFFHSRLRMLVLEITNRRISEQSQFPTDLHTDIGLPSTSTRSLFPPSDSRP